MSSGATRALLAALLLAGCGDDKPARSAAPKLPGAIWYVEDRAAPTLVRFADGTRGEIGTQLYPSPFALPDGRLVAIASRGDGTAESEQLALVAATGRVQRVGPSAMQVRDPAVDPRGRWIVIAANVDGHSDLYRIELGAGGEVTRLTNNPEGNFRPAVLGDSIVYVSSRDGDSEIYRDEQRLTSFHRDDWEPTPSPDGRTIAFLSDREGTVRVFLMGPDGTGLRRLTAREGGGEESAPVWSPDGKHLAYVVDGKVVVRELATGAERTVTPDGESDLEPSFSPDGTWIAVARARGGEASDVWVLPLGTGAPVLIAKDARLPRWLPR